MPRKSHYAETVFDFIQIISAIWREKKKIHNTSFSYRQAMAVLDKDSIEMKVLA